MNLSDRGIAFIIGWEGLKLQLYNDDGKPSATSKGNATIGYGHLVHEGPIDGRASEAPFRNGITAEQALALKRADAARFVAAVNRYTTIALTQNQFDAMVDFAFNCGMGAYAKIAPVVNARGDVCAALLQYVNPPWAREALTRRRRAECAMFYGTATPMEEDEMWRRHNEVAATPYWKDGHTFVAGESATVQLGVDLPRVMALSPKAIDLEVYSTSGMLGLIDGNGDYAGQVNDRRREAVIRVVPVNGAIRVSAGAFGARVTLFGVVGYVA